jgi:predicted nucleic acid-binding protein
VAGVNEPEHSRQTLFLDANVLVSAAWKENAETARIWQLDGARLVTSSYVMAEVRRNLPTVVQIERLRGLLRSVEVLFFQQLPEPVEALALPEKDRPVLAGAVQARADYLITGDKKHFSMWFGKTICGVKIEPPTDLFDLFQLRRD